MTRMNSWVKSSFIYRVRQTKIIQLSLLTTTLILENFIMDDDPVWYPLGGMDNIFRLNSEMPHRRPPQSRVLRSAYRTEKGSLWPEPEGLTPGSLTGFPARSPTTVYPGHSTMQKKVDRFYD